MLALLFGGVVGASLLVSSLLYTGALPASPMVLSLVALVHGVFALLFFRAYRQYHAIHRLVLRGRGELFLLALNNLINTTRTRGFRDHYRLRKCQGLVLTGQSLEALSAIEDYRREVKRPGRDALALSAVEVEANLQLGQLTWSKAALDRANQRAGSGRHPELRASAARFLGLTGDVDGSLHALAALRRSTLFPWTSTVRSRNVYWYALALRASGDERAAAEAFEEAQRLAPETYYGRLAARPF